MQETKEHPYLIVSINTNKYNFRKPASVDKNTKYAIIRRNDWLSLDKSPYSVMGIAETMQGANTVLNFCLNIYFSNKVSTLF